MWTAFSRTDTKIQRTADFHAELLEIEEEHRVITRSVMPLSCDRNECDNDPFACNLQSVPGVFLLEYWLQISIIRYLHISGALSVHENMFCNLAISSTTLYHFCRSEDLKHDHLISDWSLRGTSSYFIQHRSQNRLQSAKFLQLGDKAAHIFNLAASLARWGFYNHQYLSRRKSKI